MCFLSRGATEYLRSIGEREEKLNNTAVQRLKAACDTFRECAASFTELNCREQAAEAHKERARCLRSVGQQWHLTIMLVSVLKQSL